MKILIATDGSEFGEVAVEKICEMINDRKNFEIRIVSAYQHPMMVAAAPYPIPVGYNPEVEKEMSESAAKAVAQAAEKISTRFPALNENLTTRVLSGSPEREIVEEAEKWGADLIVVGSHGYGFWERMFVGSVSNAVVHHAPCSVMVVRQTKH
ncbi:MAG TPA: universal stress protein [Pyrinomonadaceae bacterium]|nr:universal stress protein [Pyrinomonadaceae bacterium]